MKVFSILFLFCWCINISGQESLPDSIDFYIPYSETVGDWDTEGWTDVVWSEDPNLHSLLNPSLVNFLELYEEYETQCFNDSTEQCFNYYKDYYLFGSALDSLGVGEKYKTPCSKNNFDLGISINYLGTGKEWVHVQPSFLGFIKYLKDKMRKL